MVSVVSEPTKLQLLQSTHWITSVTVHMYLNSHMLSQVFSLHTLGSTCCETGGGNGLGVRMAVALFQGLHAQLLSLAV